eukprot:386647-Alexandrium_andersonii.AAC.1
MPDGTLWLIAKAFYGQRRALHLWQEYAARILQKEVGVRRLKTCVAYFWHPTWDVRLSIHADDIDMCGPEDRLQQVSNLLNWYLVLTMEGPFNHGEEDCHVGRVAR